MYRKITLCAIIITISLSFGGNVQLSDIRLSPRLLNYQGYLTDTQGNPINDSFDFTFRIYDAASSGSQLWTETQFEVPILKGIFNVLLGGVTPIPDSVFTKGTSRWLELRFNSQTLAPRTQIVSAPYAYTSTYSDTALYARTGVSYNYWTYLVSNGADTTLQIGGRWGLARPGNTLFGAADSTHVNFGVACTTGTSGQDFKYCTVAGGYLNKAGAYYSTVAGGSQNIAGNTTVSSCATVGGGYQNRAGGDFYATVGGGYNNAATGYTSSTVAGGYNNAAGNSYAVVAGGQNNTASGANANVGGGQSNTASASYACVGGGYNNDAAKIAATISGGYSNSADSNYATVGGGYDNTASGYSAVISGGGYNIIKQNYATICGGVRDTVIAPYGAVLGGYSNIAGDSMIDTAAAVCGGFNNTAIGKFTFVGGGSNNTASLPYASVAGGYNNKAGSDYAIVGGGKDNTAQEVYTTVCGGESNYAFGSHAAVAGGILDTVLEGCGFATGLSTKVGYDCLQSAAFTTSHTTADNQVRAASFSTGTVDFAMDHPKDPMNKILNQYGVSSDEVMSQYSGSIILDDNGRATVNLPDYFDDINRNPRILLTGVGSADVVYVAEDVKRNQFVIGGKPGVKVYWQVTAERKDIHAEIARIQTPVVQDKKGDLRGHSIDDDAMIGTYDRLEKSNPGEFTFRTEEGRNVNEQSKKLVGNK